MGNPHKCLMIGAGGMAGAWIRSFLPTFAERLEVVGLVDVNEAPLSQSGDFLKLPADRRFTDYRRALDAVEADFAIIVVPPAHHTDIANACMTAGLDVLCEKPVADTWEKCLAMVAAQKQTGKKVQIIQNYRYTERILTFKDVLTSGRVGRLNYLLGRFAADYRVRNAWGKFRHEIPHALLVEGSVHHFDQLRNLAGGDCLTLAGFDWNPSWSSFDGESSGLYVMRFDSDVRGLYEGNCNEVGWQTSWHQEYYRAECEGGAVILDADNRVRVMEHTGGAHYTVADVPAIRPPLQGHQAQIGQFLDWLDGGAAPETVLSDNMKTAAMLFAAIEASETGRTIDVAAKAAEAS
ncbi:MAG: Gfo/Idh/MocA family oxidoreductase [Armatimonadetes bacterium]|nr:Gfo/Idh/MocA family oxidoreductase [Armatimonadota bacterium]